MPDTVSERVIISIHTTRKVVTVSPSFFPVIFSDFNPHHPQGGDMNAAGVMNTTSLISIHTTRKVVTEDTDPWAMLKTISIHTTRKVVTFAHNIR